MPSKTAAKNASKPTPVPPSVPPQETAQQTVAEIGAVIRRHHDIQSVGLDLQRAALRLAELGCAEHSYAVQKVSMRIQRMTPGQAA